MKVMKKIIKILIMLIVILLAIIIYKKVSLNKSIENNREIKGDLITDNVHAVTLKDKEVFLIKYKNLLEELQNI